MKKGLLITLSILILLFLIILLFINHSQNVKKERQWYIGQLHFDFSGEIDSSIFLRKGLGLISFHVTRGNVDRSLESYENKLNDQLESNGNLRFLVFKSKEKIEIEFPMNRPTQYLPGDSICVNTNENHIVIYRNGKEISKVEAIESLRGRPF